MSLEIKASWASIPPGVNAAELAATWGTLELTADGKSITSVEDALSGLSRRHLDGSLYPLAEWIAFNWWFLSNDSRPADFILGRPTSASQVNPHWFARHNLRGAGDGFAWPDLWMVPVGREILLRWGSGEDNGRVRFIGSGSARVDGDETLNVLGRFVEQVVERLRSSGLKDTPLQQEWGAIQTAGKDEVEFCRALASLGLDPYDTDSEYSELVIHAAQTLSSVDLEVLVTSAAPGRLRGDIDWIGDAESRLKSSHSDWSRLTKLDQLSGPDPSRSSAEPWRHGYEAAQYVRHSLGVASGQPFDFGDLLAYSVVPSSDDGLIALAGAWGESVGVVLGQKRGPNATRFVQARAMWRFVTRTEDTTRILIGSGHSQASQMERAFAAELLAPAEAIAERLASGASDTEVLAEHFQVSALVVGHQIENQLSYA